MSELICLICKSTLKQPVFLPCHCTVCGVHIQNLYTHNDKEHIECKVCFKVSKVPKNGFAANKLAESVLNKRGNKLENEKEFQINLKKYGAKLELLHSQHFGKYAEQEMAIFDHFAALKRDIDLRRETFKLKIDEIAHQLITRTKNCENEFKDKLLHNKIYGTYLGSESADRLFRSPKFIISSVDQLLSEQNRKITELEASLNSLLVIKDDLEYCTFNPSVKVEEIVFGQLRLNEEQQKSALTLNEYEEFEEEDDGELFYEEDVEEDDGEEIYDEVDDGEVDDGEEDDGEEDDGEEDDGEEDDVEENDGEENDLDEEFEEEYDGELFYDEYDEEDDGEEDYGEEIYDEEDDSEEIYDEVDDGEVDDGEEDDGEEDDGEEDDGEEDDVEENDGEENDLDEEFEEEYDGELFYEEYDEEDDGEEDYGEEKYDEENDLDNCYDHSYSQDYYNRDDDENENVNYDYRYNDYKDYYDTDYEDYYKQEGDDYSYGAFSDDQKQDDYDSYDDYYDDYDDY